MRSWFLGLVLAHVAALLLLVAPAAAASGVHAGRGTEHAHPHPQPHPHRQQQQQHRQQQDYASWVPRYLRLAWLRDSVADWVFSRPSRPAGSDPRRASWHRAAHAAKYATQTVLRFSVMTAEEEAALAAAAQRLFLDVWAFNNHTGTVDIRLDREDVASLLTLLPRSLHHAFTPLVPDLAAAVRDTFPGAAGDAALPNGLSAAAVGGGGGGGGGGTDNLFFRDYQPYPVIVQWMKLLDAMFPFVDMVSVGTSAEGREILGLRVGAAPRGAPPAAPGHGGSEPEPEPAATRKTILITGGLHAREWISSSSVSYIAWAIITGYGSTNMITKLVDHFDIVLVPVVNPDGYAYTWETDRLWRKTRQATNFRFCRGFDLDHVFGYEWDSKARDEPCSETYGGESAFQAVEAQALSSWARRQVDEAGVEFIGFLDLHSYSQAILFPFSYSCATDPPNLENLEELAAGLAKAIRLSTGETYSVMSACEGILGADGNGTAGTRIESGGGSAMDWFYHELKAKYSYQIKLRDTGSYGFLLPRSEIVPTGEEVFSAVKYFGDFLLGNNGIEKSMGGEDGEREEGEREEGEREEGEREEGEREEGEREEGEREEGDRDREDRDREDGDSQTPATIRTADDDDGGAGQQQPMQLFRGRRRR